MDQLNKISLMWGLAHAFGSTSLFLESFQIYKGVLDCEFDH